MNLGLGLIAADSYFKEGDARKVRDYEQAKREAEVSALADRTNADRSGYQLKDVQNKSNATLVPQQQANAQATLGLAAAELAGQVERQATEIETKGINADVALSDAGLAQTNQPLQQKVKTDQLTSLSLTAAADVKSLPAKLQRAAVQGTLDQQGQQEVVMGNIGILLGRKDKASAIEFANAIAKQSNVGPKDNGKTLTDIVPVRKGQNGAPDNGYNFVTSDGETKFIPEHAIQGPVDKMKSGAYDHITGKDGSIFTLEKNTGATNKIYQGDLSSARNQHTPAEVQAAEWVLKNKSNPEAMAAWEKVRSTRGGQKEFIQALMAKSIKGGETQQELTDQTRMFGKLYDEIQGGKTGAPGLQNVTSNSGANPTIGNDPAINSLLGLPP